MPFQDLWTALDNRDTSQDKKVVLNAVIKHLEQERRRVKPAYEERNPGFTDVFFLFRDVLAAK